MKTYIQQRRQNMSDGQQRQENKTLTIQSKQESEVNAKETHTTKLNNDSEHIEYKNKKTTETCQTRKPTQPHKRSTIRINK